MKISFLLLGIFIFSLSFSQTGKKLDYRFSHLTTADGLAGNQILFMTQDDKGYIWIYSIFNGLQRYDGIRFQTFGEQFLNKENNTFEIHELTFTEGHLYVRMADEIYVFDPFRQKFNKVKYQDNSERISFFNANGEVWKIGSHSITIINKDGSKKLEQIFLNKISKTNPILLYDTVRQNYWFRQGNELIMLHGKSRKVFSSKNPEKNSLLSFLDPQKKLGISNMTIDEDDNFWISTWVGGLIKYNLATNQIREYNLAEVLKKEKHDVRKDPLGVTNFFTDNHKQLWVCTYGAGLLKYNNMTDRFDYMIFEKNNRNSIQYNYEQYALIQDKQENLWVGTDMGISIFNPYNEYFKTLRNEPGNVSSMPSNEIINSYQTRNRDLWVGTWGGGIAVYDSNFTFKKNYKFRSVVHNMVWCFAEDKKGRIWAGCQEGWIHRFNPVTTKFEKPFRILGNISTVTYAMSDNKGNLYFGYNNGNIAKWDANKDSFYLYKHRVLHNNRPVPIQLMLSVNQQSIWVTNGKFLYHLDPQKLLYTDSISLFSGKYTSNNIQWHSSFSLVNDSILLVASFKGKPGYINVNSKKFKELKIPEEIVRKRITDLERDENGKIWFTTGSNLYQFIPGPPSQLINYYIGNEIINGSFRQYGMLHLNANKHAIWTSSEIVIFNPKQLSTSKKGSKVNLPTITGLKVFDQYFLIDSLLLHNKPVSLKYNQNFITIEFAPLLYAMPYLQKYFYKLSGVNDNWVPDDGNFRASYTNLKPGKYIFSIKPESAFRDDQIVSFQIEITPPFYQTWWFYTAAILAAILIGIFLIKRRIQVIRKEAGLRQKVLETEMAALRAQMNPHFIFNCISAIDNLIQNDEKDKATTYLSTFAKLIRHVLDSSKNEVVPFYKDFDTIRLFIELERLRSNNKFDYKLAASSELIEGDYKVPPMLIQPFIENAIHHGLRNKPGQNGFLEIAAHVEKDLIIYSITDNGVGRARAAELNRINRPEHNSYGIQISRDRIKNFNRSKGMNNRQHLNDDLIITDLFEDDKPAGTSVCLKLKINS